jgi:cyclophilin family peptidyl-prolyl cis-trans isomerase
VENFWAYVDAGAYNNTLVHRLVPGFVMQTGGFEATIPPENIATFDPIVNEFGRSNTRGTVAMAKVGGDPNSATSQWFINLVDNSSNLDNQNGGFTVFAEVAGNGMVLVDELARTPIYNAGGPFDSIPLFNYRTGPVQVSNLVAINRVSRAVFGAESSDPGAIAVEVVGSNIILTAGPRATRGADIRIFALDENGQEIEGTFRATGPAKISYSGLADTVEGPIFVNISVTRTGAMTGTIWGPFGAHRVRGLLDISGADFLQFDFRDTRTAIFDINPFSGQLSFTFFPPEPSEDFTTIPLQAAASTGARGDFSPLDRRQINTLLIPEVEPEDRLQGAGFFTARFDRRGFARIVGQLPDGTRLNGGYFSLANGDPDLVDLPMAIFRQGRFPQQISASFQILINPPEDVAALTGGMNYQSAENLQRLVQPDAINLNLDALGTFWQFQRGVNMIAPEEELSGFSLHFDRDTAVLPQSVLGFGSWSATNRPAFLNRPQNNRIIAPPIGTFRGAFSYDFAVGRAPAERPIPFQGILLSEDFDLGNGLTLRGAGFQLTEEGSVPVLLEAVPPLF